MCDAPTIPHARSCPGDPNAEPPKPTHHIVRIWGRPQRLPIELERSDLVEKPPRCTCGGGGTVRVRGQEIELPSWMCPSFVIAPED